VSREECDDGADSRMGITRLVQRSVTLQFVEMVSLAPGEECDNGSNGNVDTTGLVPQLAKIQRVSVSMGFWVLEKNATVAATTTTTVTRVLVPPCLWQCLCP
jgi:hypothetical protein